MNEANAMPAIIKGAYGYRHVLIPVDGSDASKAGVREIRSNRHPGRIKTSPRSRHRLGSHGRRGLARIAMGSQAAEVFRESPVPVLLIRAVYR